MAPDVGKLRLSQRRADCSQGLHSHVLPESPQGTRSIGRQAAEDLGGREDMREGRLGSICPLDSELPGLDSSFPTLPLSSPRLQAPNRKSPQSLISLPPRVTHQSLRLSFPQLPPARRWRHCSPLFPATAGRSHHRQGLGDPGLARYLPQE